MISGSKKGKILCSLFFSLCLLCGLFVTVPVEAATSGDWEYKILEDGTIEIKDYHGNAAELVIPDTIDGKSVTSIGAITFYKCSSLTSVEIPNGVTKIGGDAFLGCSNLTDINIPKSVTSIGNGAFADCSSLSDIHVAEDSEAYASKDGILYDKSYETLICCPGKKQGIVTIPSGVTKIESYAFRGCNSLTSINIPGSVAKIMDRAFSGCDSLSDINVAEDSKSYASKDGILYNGACKVLICCPAGKQGAITVPSGVTNIWDYAFSDCSSLTSITIPSGVVSMRNYTFKGCSSLTSVTLPSGVTTIGDATFYGCSSLTSVTLSSGVTYIGDNAFYGCSSLTSLEVPSGVTEIGSGAFYGCSSLTSLEVPSGVTKIGSSTFHSCSSLTGVTLPSGVTEIGSSAFYNCSSLKSIELPSEVTEIKAYTFYDCNSLASVAIPGVTSIGYGGFYKCNSLTSIALSIGLTYIGDNAFKECSSLSSITLPSGVTHIGESAFRGCDLTSIEVPSGVTEIKDYTFYECSNLANVKIPDEVTSIGMCAFGRCISLEDITLPNKLTSIGNSAFFDCRKLTDIEIPDEVTEIQEAAFMECNKLTSVIIPETVTKIGNYVFYNFATETNNKKLTIYGKPGSVAEKYATENGIKFKCSHILVKVTKPAKAPTCTEVGKTAETCCSICGEIVEAQKDIPAKGHTYQPTIQKATAKKNGAIVIKCITCGSIKSRTDIYAASSIKLSKTSFTYNGKNKKPAVTVKDSKGNKLPAGSYKITCPKTSKKVGKYTVTVTLQGNYSGTVKLTYRITPKGTKLSKLTAKKKGFTAKWKKQTKQTTGYQLQYSTSKKFKGAKTVTVKKNKTISKNIKKLKAGKKYYVRIRTYKTVKIKGKNVKICAGWSKAKSVKTKK